MADGEILKKLEDSTKDAVAVQLQTLHTILQRNGRSSYLQRYGASLDTGSFREAVPLSCYDDYADYIDRMADGGGGDDDGDRPVLSVDPLVCFFNSSGTSSMKPKLIPYFDSPPSKAASHIAHQGSVAILRRLFPPRQSINKVLWFIYAGNVTYTKGGFKAMAASSFPLQSNNKNPSPFLSTSASPREVILGSNVEQQMYCHILCGLRNLDFIDGIRAPYAVGLIRAFALLEFKWEQICEDLKCGFPSMEITDIAMRDSVTEVLAGPQLDLSKRIRTICEGKNWGGIVGKLWPNVRYIKCVCTGSMEQYYQKLKYYAGEIPVLGGDYFASECCVGINLDILQPPQLTRFVLLPTAAYFEFLPFTLDEEEIGDDAQETVDFSGVEVGKMYEIVVTTYRGFFRYRLGDVVRVVGFHNTSPEVEFVMRAPKTPAEILTERDLMTAMGNFQLVLRTVKMPDVTEFASFFDLDSIPKQLKIFLEVAGVLQDEKLQELGSVLRRNFSSLEDGLGGVYKLRKGRGEVGPLLVSIVKPGSFNRLLQMATENGAPASQYKPPKIIRNLEIVHFMEGSALLTVSFDSSD